MHQGLVIFPLTDEGRDHFEMVYGLLARFGGECAKDVLAQCDRISMMLPCGQTIPGTSVPGRKLIRPGYVVIPASVTIACRDALQAFALTIAETP